MLQGWFIWVFEKGRAFEGENGTLLWYLLHVVDRKGSPVPNVEMYYTAYGLRSYKSKVLDHAEEGFKKKKIPVLPGGRKDEIHFKKY